MNFEEESNKKRVSRADYTNRMEFTFHRSFSCVCVHLLTQYNHVITSRTCTSSFLLGNKKCKFFLAREETCNRSALHLLALGGKKPYDFYATSMVAHGAINVVKASRKRLNTGGAIYALVTGLLAALEHY